MKRLFSAVLAMAAITLVTACFTSCGGDGDGVSKGGSETSPETFYFGEDSLPYIELPIVYG